MNTTSSQVSAFVVLVLALLGVGYFTNQEELNTSVTTADKTLLPFSFDSDQTDQLDVAGFELDYPRGWSLESQGEGEFTLSRPIEMADRGGESYNITLRLVEGGGEAPLDPLTQFPPEAGTAQAVPAAGYPAARVVTETGETVSFQQLVRLTDANTFLVMEGSNIAATDWDDLSEDLDQIVKSVRLGEDFAIIPDVFTFTTPANWEVVLDRKMVFSLESPVGEGQPAAQLQFGLFTNADILNLLSGFVQQLKPDAQMADITDPLDMLRLLEGFEGSPEQQVTVVAPVGEVTYFGHPGLEFGYADPNGQVSVAVVNTGDEGYHTIVLKLVSDVANLESYLADMATVVVDGTYNTPHPRLLK